MKSIVIYFSRPGYNYVNGEIKDLKIGNIEVIANKIIKPFCSHEGSGMGRSEEDIKDICKESKVEKGLAIHGVNFIEKELKQWII